MSAPQQNTGTSDDLKAAAANLAKSRLDLALWDDAAAAALTGDPEAAPPVPLR